jgi:hypothetical protein
MLGQQCEQVKQRKSALPNVRTFALYSNFLFFLFLPFFFLLCFLFFSEAWSRNTNKFQHNGIYLYKMNNTRYELVLNFQIMVAVDYGFFFVWCSVVVLVYCTNKIEELKDRIIRRKHKIEWQQGVLLWCEGGWV